MHLGSWSLRLLLRLWARSGGFVRAQAAVVMGRHCSDEHPTRLVHHRPARPACTWCLVSLGSGTRPFASHVAVGLVATCRQPLDHWCHGAAHRLDSLRACWAWQCRAHVLFLLACALSLCACLPCAMFACSWPSLLLEQSPCGSGEICIAFRSWMYSVGGPWSVIDRVLWTDFLEPCSQLTARASALKPRGSGLECFRYYQSNS